MDEDRWNGQISRDIIERQLAVNDYQLINLIDARRCAADYLKNAASLLDGIQCEQLIQVAKLYEDMVISLKEFRDKVQAGNHTELEYNMMKVKVVDSDNLRKEEAEVLKQALEIEYRIDGLVSLILEEVM